MTNKCYVICNSKEALDSISSGMHKDISSCDLFTCNSSYGFFRTSGDHFNLVVDVKDILRHVALPESLYGGYSPKMYFSNWAEGRGGLKESIGRDDLLWLPFLSHRSGGLQALMFAFSKGYEEIWFLGYNYLDERVEWENLEMGYERTDVFLATVFRK